MFTDPDTQQQKNNSELDKWWSKKTADLFLASREFTFFKVQSDATNRMIKEQYLDPIVDEILMKVDLGTKIEHAAAATDLLALQARRTEAMKAVRDAWEKVRPKTNTGSPELDQFVPKVEGLITKLDGIFKEINLQ